MQGRTRIVLVFAVLLSFAMSSVAFAHPDHGGSGSNAELFPGEGVVTVLDKQHDGEGGHLPPVQENVDVIGKAEIADRTSDGAGITGRVADVNAHGDYAYLNAFAQPTCEPGTTGVHVIDISDPTAPFEVEDAFIPAQEGLFAGEGIQVVEYRNDYFTGDVLIHNNELCAGGVAGAPLGGVGGISLWDVSEPTEPAALAENVGDFTAPETTTPRPAANGSHSMFAWYDRFDRKHYVAMIDNVESTDVDILDITNPAAPVLVNDTLDLNEPPFSVGQDSPDNLTSVFSHDMFVKRIGRNYVMSLNYWDGGYVLLNVTNPTAGNVTLMDHTDYAELDEEQLERGREITPEGNAHQSEISPRNDFVIGTDEDFNPYRTFASIESGPLAGTEFNAAQAGDTPTLTEDNPIAGPTTYVGQACEALPPAAESSTALVERGTCTFQLKLDNITSAGYAAGVVFNSAIDGCEGLVNMAAASETVPFFFVARQTGLQILGTDVSEEEACTTVAPAPGTPSAEVSIRAVFDGWGYVRLFDTNLKRYRGGLITADQQQVDTYAIPESQDPAYAIGFGDLSVHEVAIDPDRRSNLAYLSYYSGGFRVVEYGDDGIEEVGAFIDEGGSNLWGVQVHEIDGEQYVLASDRDYGLYIFQYNPED